MIRGSHTQPNALTQKGSTSRDPSPITHWHKFELICIKTFDECLKGNVDRIIAVQSGIPGLALQVAADSLLALASATPNSAIKS
jgi:hypothetical protein